MANWFKLAVLIFSVWWTAGGFAAPAKSNSSSPIVLTAANTLDLRDVVWGDTVGALILRANEMNKKLPAGEAINLVLYTPGGDIDAGMDLIHALQSLGRPVNTISVFSASMGFEIVESLGTRNVLMAGTLMAHQAAGGFGGSFSQVKSRFAYWMDRIDNQDARVVARTSGKYTLESYHQLIHDEYWCEGSKCQNDGFADAVVDAKCDATLSSGKGEWKTWMKMLMGDGRSLALETLMDTCPLNPNPLDIRISIGGHPIDQLYDAASQGGYWGASQAADRVKFDAETATYISALPDYYHYRMSTPIEARVTGGFRLGKADLIQYMQNGAN